MNQTIEDFIEFARSEAVRTQRLTAFADVLDEARGAVAHAAACKSAAAQSCADRDAAKAEAAQAREDVAAAKADAAAIVDAAVRSAASIANQASADAADVARNAAIEAEQAVADAKSQAQSSLQAVKDERDGISREIVSLRGEAVTLTTARDALASEVSGLESKLARVKQAIADLTKGIAT